ncbi:hypothetical protein, partial [Mycobacterium tuberculosis]|uniref:hypothetical protein n=1 Tax=Mycobacterium tuberculosis TaxID=1773 RepID=UPI001BDEB772
MTWSAGGELKARCRPKRGDVRDFLYNLMLWDLGCGCAAGVRSGVVGVPPRYVKPCCPSRPSTSPPAPVAPVTTVAFNAWGAVAAFPAVAAAPAVT